MSASAREDSVKEPIAFRFTPTKEDYVKGSRYLLMSTPWPWLVLIGAGLIALCNIVALLTSVSGMRGLMWVFLPIVLLPAFFVFVWVP